MPIDPNGAPPGYYYQAGATAYIMDPAGTYSLAGASAPTTDPAGGYSGAGASAPTLAAAGTYIPGAGATSSAAEIVDGAGTYSLAGASTPTADPGGTYSGAGASAPVEDPAGTYSSPYALDCLFLETSSVTPNNEVLSFNSVTAVANYYGDTSAEAGFAVQFFADYGTAANMLFIRFPLGGNRAHLYGANVSALTLAQLQAIHGALAITSQGYSYSASINLAGVTGFTAAATAIQAALNENLPVAAVTAGDTIAPVSVSFTGSANGLLLNVTSIASGSIETGALISGAGVPAGTQINAQFSGAPGGVGLYSLYVPAGQIAAEAMTETYGVLTVGSVSSGTVADGEQLTDASGDLPPDTAIEANLSGSGAGSTWVVNNAEAILSEALTMTGAPLSVLYTAIAGATQNSGYFSIQQNGAFNYASASLTYASGTAAALLGLTQGSGAWLAPLGVNIASEAAFMSNLVATLSDQFASFQATWPQLAEEDPASQAALEQWAQSTDGQFQFLASNTANASPAGASAPTTDPAGTYSGPGASAPSLAAAGTYIPVAGATSAAAEVVDPAGSFSLAGASAYTLAQPGYYVATSRASSETPAAGGTYIAVTGATSAAQATVDPAGSYSLAGASAPVLAQPGFYVATTRASAETPAAAGTYISAAGATSASAEAVDPAGSYSLAGASAPTLAQPGYYVPSAGASSQTPVSSGYYQPNAGATSEILAQAPVISGAAAGQTTAPLEHVAPFSSVTVGDPNSETSDSLTIKLTGGGGVLSDGAGFDGLATSGPNVYLLTGTAAGITAELDALIFTPSASTTPTTFTLTDASTAGTSASNDNTSVTVEPATPAVVSVAAYLADKPTLDGEAGGFDILDSAAALGANLDQLDDAHIDSIVILDSGEVAASVRQLTSDAAAIGKLQNANASPARLAVEDTAANIAAALATLVAQTGEIALISASGGPVVVSVATFLADQPTLDKIAGGFDVADTAAQVADSLDALNADLDVGSIALTDAGVPTLSITLKEAENDTIALDAIADPHGIAIADSAPATLSSTEAIYLSGENISVSGAQVIATGTVATMAIMGQIITSLLESQGYTLAVLDAAANIQGLTLAQINNLSLRGVLLLQASDASVALTASLAASLAAANMTVTAPSGDQVMVSDTAAHLQGMSASQIAGLAAIGVTGLASTNANVSYSPAQTAAILASGLSLSAPGSDTVTENFANGNYSIYQGGQLIQQQSVNLDGSYDIAYFNLTGKAYSSYENIYNSAGTLLADAENNTNGSGTLLLYASGLTVASSSAGDSVTTGTDTFALAPQSVETTSVQNSMSSETFVYGPGFGQDTLIGFLETTSTHDLLQFSASTYGFPSTQSQTADAQALLNGYATGTTNTVISDPGSDTLTLNNHAISTFQNNLQDFKFT